MSITDQFRQYAKKAILSAATAKTDRQSLLELARTWTRAGVTRTAVYPFEYPQFA
jgi:hypothetical protein